MLDRDISDTCDEITLRELGTKYPEIGKKILTTPSLFTKCSDYSIYSIGRASSENTECIIQNENLSNQLGGYELADLASRYPSFATDILKNPTLQAKLNGGDLDRLCSSSPEAAIFILKNMELVKRCDSRQLDNIAEVSHASTMYVLETPFFHEISCNSSFLNRVAVEYKDAAMQILQTPKLAKCLDNYILTDIACAHVEAANHILQNPTMSDELDDYALGKIGCKHLEVAKWILRTPTMLDKCEQSTIAEFGEKHLEIAQFILNTKTINCDNEILCRIGCSHVETALSILKNPRYAQYCNAYTLKKLALKNSEIAMAILNNPHLRQLCYYSISEIGRVHLETAKFILKNSPEFFDNNDLRLVGLDYEECAKMILSTRALKSKCDPRTIDILKRAHVKENKDAKQATSTERLIIIPSGTTVSDIHVKENECVEVMVGYKTNEEAKIGKESSDKLMSILNKMKLLDRYPASTKILILLGDSTYFETYTPDAKGKPQDGYGHQLSRGTFIGNFFARSVEQQAKDIQSAIDDPQHKFKVISPLKI